MNGRRWARWLLLAALSSLTVVLLLAVAGAPVPLRASELNVDTATLLRPPPQPAGLTAGATLTETYAAVIAASPLFAPALDSLFVPIVTR